MHPRDNMPLSNLRGPFPIQGSVRPNHSNSSGLHAAVDGYQPHNQPEQQVPLLQPQQQQQVAPVLIHRTEQRFVRYACDHPACLHYNFHFGFPTVELWVQHLPYCGFRNSVEHLLPTYTEYQVTIPIEIILWGRQVQNPFPQQMVPTPMVLQPPIPSFQELPGTSLYNNIGISDYVAMPNDNTEDMVTLDSAILHDSGSFDSDVSGESVNM